MTSDEASTRYKIPLSILKEYESWGLCNAVKSVMGAWQYNEQDIERLSLIMTLHDVGFASDDVERYMRLLVSPSDTSKERLQMLQALRGNLMDELHIKQKNVDRLDYLRQHIHDTQL